MHDITLVYTMLKVLLRLPNQPATTLRALVMSSGMLRRDISCRFIIIIIYYIYSI